MHNKARETQKNKKNPKKCIDKHIFLIYNVFNKTKERKNGDLELIFQGSPMSTLKFIRKNKFDFVFRVENGDEINITRLFKY